MTLRQPFYSTRSDSAVILKMLKGERPELTIDIVKDEQILRLVGECWEKNPDRRPDASTVCQVLEEVIKSIRLGWYVFGRFSLVNTLN